MELDGRNNIPWLEKGLPLPSFAGRIVIRYTSLPWRELKILLIPGYARQLPFAGPVGSHWLVEAMKTAFALRTHLGDPGSCTSKDDCFLDLEGVLNDTLSEDFADGLRYMSIKSAYLYSDKWNAETLTCSVLFLRFNISYENDRHL